MRFLIVVPVVHSEADLGTLASPLRKRFVGTFGEERWQQQRRAVEAMWTGLRQRILALPLTWASTRIYQDGLPVCGKEALIVRDLAAAGSQNHKLVLELVQRGAQLMGTEQPELLLQEYARVQRLLAAAQQQAPDAEVEPLRQEGERLLRARDAFMAQRIRDTLADGELGLLFVGLLHRVDELLAGELELRTLVHNLPLRAEARPGRTKPRGDV